MITPEQLDNLIDQLWERNRCPRVNLRCDEIKQFATQRLHDAENAVHQGLHGSDREKEIRSKLESIQERQNQFVTLAARWTEKTRLATATIAKEQHNIAERSQQLRQEMEVRGAQLRRAYEQRELQQQQEVMHILTSCRRRIENDQQEQQQQLQLQLQQEQQQQQQQYQHFQQQQQQQHQSFSHPQYFQQQQQHYQPQVSFDSFQQRQNQNFGSSLRFQ